MPRIGLESQPTNANIIKEVMNTVPVKRSQAARTQALGRYRDMKKPDIKNPTHMKTIPIVPVRLSLKLLTQAIFQIKVQKWDVTVNLAGCCSRLLELGLQILGKKSDVAAKSKNVENSREVVEN